MAAYFLRKEQMQMKLVLAEKPSVAQSIAKVLGAAKREDGYLEGKDRARAFFFLSTITTISKALFGHFCK